jgi:hypothetical protein
MFYFVLSFIVLPTILVNVLADYLEALSKSWFYFSLWCNFYVFRKHGRKVGPATGIGSPRKGTKKAELMAGFFLIDMHQNLEKPAESLGIEMEADDNDTSDFQQRYMVSSEFMQFLYSRLGASA